MLCMKCRRDIDGDSLYCKYCGKKQPAAPARKALKRPNGTGTVVDLGPRRKKRWAARVTQGIDAESGKQVYLYIGYFEKKTDAVRALEEYAITPVTAKYNLTLGEAFQEWSAVHFPNLSKNGIDGYRTAWNYLQRLEQVKLRDIRTAHFQSVIDQTVQAGKGRAVCEKIRNLCSQLSKYAMQNDIVNKNYAGFLVLPKSDTKEKEIFSQEEIEILRQNDALETVRIILTLLYTGFRIGELFELTKNNVHLEEGYLVGGFKTEAGTDRIVPINDKIRPYIEAWYSFGPIPTIAGEGQAPYLLPNESGEKRDIANFRNRCYYPTLKHLGIRTLTPHATRHTFASLMSKSNVKPEVLQKIIGHADYSTTANIYIHNDLEELRQAINEI